MRRLWWLLLLISLPGHSEVNITRELVAPAQVAPGQPLRLAVTFWTDSWFNPPPSWPTQEVKNGALLTTPLPNQLLTRQADGKSWSGVRLERLVSAWDAGKLVFPALEITLTSPGQPPHTVQLPAIEHDVAWPPDVTQPDRFLPASKVTLTGKVVTYHAGEGEDLHVGDVIERQVTVQAEGAVPSQIPQLLYAIPGQESQRLAPVNRLLDSGRGDFMGGQREERLRYMPTTAGTVTLPPLTLRWWNSEQQQWQQESLPGAEYKVGAPRTAGGEAVLRASSLAHWKPYAIGLVLILLLAGAAYLARHSLLRGWCFAREALKRFWTPVPLPGLLPVNKEK
ncbi:oxygen tolerance domain protein [Aeromonas veronii]|uniref:oxygen tolerance domain protein n=1 Tax=Aeromonas veronii TaxID=654 RepID=UPI0032EB1F4E